MLVAPLLATAALAKSPFASIPSPSGNAVHIGPLQLRFYGMAIALGVFAAIWLADRRHVARGGHPDDFGYIGIRAALAGLVGARLYHVITDWKSFEGRWGDVVKVWEGGLGIPGGLLAGTLVGLWAAHRRGLATPDALDIAAPAIPLAQAIGRLGNWFNQELFGKPSTLPWAIKIDPRYRPVAYEQSATFHPTFLYEALWNLALCGVLLLLDRRKVVPRGKLFAIFVFGYGVGRLWVEALRIDKASKLLGLRVNIWVSLIAIIGGALWFLLAKPAPANAPAGLGADDEDAFGFARADDDGMVDDDMVDVVVDDGMYDVVVDDDTHDVTDDAMGDRSADPGEPSGEVPAS